MNIHVIVGYWNIYRIIKALVEKIMEDVGVLYKASEAASIINILYDVGRN